MTQARIVVSLPLTEAANRRLGEAFDARIASAPMGASAFIEAAAAHQAEGVIIGMGLKCTAEVIARLPETVKVLATTSVGYDHIDLAAARARGIVVTNTPDVLTDCTADTHMLLLLGAMRRAKQHVRNMDSGWTTRNGFATGLGIKVSGKTMGIVGMGRIGRAVAQRARGFGMPIIYHNRSRLDPALEEGARYYASLDEMLPHCEVLSLNLPGGQGVLMTRETFALLPKGAVFVNSARGSLVDEEALIEALASGHLGAAGLDVFQKEPDYDQRLNELPNTFLLPHIGSATEETRTAMAMRAIDNVEAVLAGRPALDALT
jgi:lactate dehydrogenase-like 2-hydroxyacid dehydrogenase